MRQYFLIIMNYVNNAHRLVDKTPHIPLLINLRVDTAYLAMRNYPMYSQITYNKTNHWLWCMVYTVMIMKMIFAHDQNHNYDPQEMHRQTIYGLMTALRSIVFNLQFFKKRHWKLITFKLDIIVKIFGFIVQEIDYRLMNHLDEEENSRSVAVMEILNVFLMKWLAFFNAYQQRQIRTERTKYFRSINGIKLKIELYRCKLQESLQRASISTGTLESRKYTERLMQCLSDYQRGAKIIDDYIIKMRKWRKESQTCQSIKCGKLRGIQKFYICKRCLAAIYCSRRCFKRDWNCVDSIHRNYCAKYVDIMNNKISVKKWGEVFKKSPWLVD